MMRSLYHFLMISHHMITKVIKTKFIVGTISYIGKIGFFTRYRMKMGKPIIEFFGWVSIVGIVNKGLFVDYSGGGNTQKMQSFGVPTGTDFSKIIIWSNNVNTFGSESVKIGRKYYRMSFTFSGTLLSDRALVKGYGSH